LSSPGIPEGEALLRELDGALVRNSATWILDIQVAASGTSTTSIPDGPFPARAFVSENGHYQGEIIVWITAGHISGLEFAWVTDEPPTRWPQAQEMDIEVQGGQ